MAEKMTLGDVLEQSGVMLGAGKLPTENQLVAWREAIALHLARPAQAVDTGNLVDDPLYKALDALYERGWSDSEKHKHDPRGTNEWQAVQDIFRANRAIGNAQAEGFAGFQIVENADVPDGEIWIYDKSKITTQATPNAHE